MNNQQFASDNYAGMCPEALTALTEANHGHAPAYGEDEWTRRACDAFRDLFGTDCEVFFVFNGTAGNALALASLCASYHSVVCHREAHVETDECGAPEFFSHGAKILLADGTDGRIDPEALHALATRRTDLHFPPVRAVSVTQATEVGTVYRPDHLTLIQEVAGRLRLRFHMDGARFAQAVAFLDLPPAAVTWKAGVDVLTFGGVKNGLAFGEAVVFFNRDLARDFEYRCKQAGQLASKTRLLAAPWLALLESGAWLRNARHAHARARRLAAGLEGLPGCRVMFPVESNAVFLDAPAPVLEGLRARGWRFYTFIGVGGARLMCAWDTREDTVDAFLADARTAAGA